MITDAIFTFHKSARQRMRQQLLVWIVSGLLGRHGEHTEGQEEVTTILRRCKRCTITNIITIYL